MLRDGLRPRLGAIHCGAIALVLALSCQSGPAAKAPARSRDSQFPSEADLSKLPPAPAPETLSTPEVDEVDTWTLVGPFPALVEVAPHEPVSGFERVLADGVAQRAGLALATEAMHCTARELGHFVLARSKPPPTTLMEFMAARCGAVGADFRPAWYHGEVPSGTSDEDLLVKWRPQIESMLQRTLAGGSVAAGLWFGREGNRAAVSIVTTQRRVIVTPFSPVVTGDRLALAGEVLVNTQQIFAHVNQGEFGYADCVLDPNVALPRFAFSCPIAPGDPLALLEIGMREPGRILALGGLRVLARRGDELGSTWRRRSLGGGKPAATQEEFAQALSVAIGQVRSGAELHPLGLSLKQSEQANELVPHVVAGSLGEGSPALADMAVLGLIAGWEVGGAIKDASIASVVSSGGLDANRWLETALARPSGRAALLDPAARVLAVGSLVSNEPPLAAAIAVTYQLFGEEDFQADAQRVFERVTALRAAQGRPAPESFSAARASVESVAQSLPSGRVDPVAALDEALAAAAKASGLPIQGWVLEASQLDALQLPAEILEPASVRFAVAVGYYQPEDDPWGHYVALIIATAPGRDI